MDISPLTDQRSFDLHAMKFWQSIFLLNSPLFCVRTHVHLDVYSLMVEITACLLGLSLACS